MKTELLSPVGNINCLMGAINGGADAIYLSGKKYGARAFAQNFTNEEMIKAIKTCHLYGVKVYATLNTIIYESEVENFLKNVKFLYENGIDAVIVQDLGMIYLIKKFFPSLHVHSSTQVHTINNYGVLFLKEMGVSRCVLAREMSLDEIKKIDKSIETEIFIHGALCVSYSGRCLFSSLNGKRSGNRGACVGSCRQKYCLTNYKSGPYPLSTKDLCSINNFKNLLDANITSFKIEGRMKSKEYVSLVTQIYRRLMDNYYNNLPLDIKDEDILKLKVLYNRNFTKGYLFNDNIYYDKSPNHIGIYIGKTTKITKDKIFIKLSSSLSRGDAIRFTNSNKGMIINKLYNEKGLLKEKINKNEIACVDNKINLLKQDDVNKTISIETMRECENIKEKKIDISFNVFAYDNLTIEITDGINTIKENFGHLDGAIKKATSKDEIIEKLSKLGNTPFKIKNINIELGSVFIPMKILNDAKRKLCDMLIEKRCEIKRDITYKYKKKKGNNSFQKSYLVNNEKDLLKVLNIADTIYITDFELYKKYKKENIYYKIPRLNYENLNFKNENLLVSDIGSLYKFKDNNNIITDYTFNITNSSGVMFLLSLGVKKVTLSLETPKLQIKEILKYSSCVEVVNNCYPELMILKNYPYKNGYLKDRFNNLFPIIYKNNYTTILHFKEFKLNEEFECSNRYEILPF